MFLSIITPVYNGEEYLKECLDSLLRQDIHEDAYEIIIVDDGSTDKTAEIITECSKEHKNIRCFSQKHCGVSAARNLGLLEAQGDYVWFVDADDFIQDNSLCELQQLIKTVHCDQLTFGAYVFYDELSEDEKRQKELGLLRSNANMGTVTVWVSLFRRYFLLEAGLEFDEELSVSEDELFLYETQLKNPAQYSLPKVIYFWRKNSNSTTMGNKKVTLQKTMKSRICFIKRMECFYNNHQGNLSVCADNLMSNLWVYLYSAAGMDRQHRRTAIRDAKTNGLYPYRRPPECTLRKTYMSNRTDLLGKVFEFVGMHIHRRWGFATMRMFLQLRRK